MKTKEIIAAFLELLPDHKAELSITHNPHKNSYETVEDYIKENADQWKGAAAMARAISADEMWEMQWYPSTPVGFCIICAPTLEELIIDPSL